MELLEDSRTPSTWWCWSGRLRVLRILHRKHPHDPPQYLRDSNCHNHLFWCFHPWDYRKFESTFAQHPQPYLLILNPQLWSALYYLPLYYEAVKSMNPVMSGVALFPQTFTVAPAAIVVGNVVTITGRYRWAIWSGWCFTCSCTGLMYLLSVDTTTIQWIFLNLVVGLGMGMLFCSMTFAVQASATARNIAFAVTFFSFFRTFGESVGVAIGGVIFQNEIKKGILTYPDLASLAVEYSTDAAHLVQVIKALPVSSTRRIELTQVYADALRVIWAVMCGFSALGLFSSLFTKAYGLDVALETEQGFQHTPESETQTTPEVVALRVSSETRKTEASNVVRGAG